MTEMGQPDLKMPVHVHGARPIYLHERGEEAADGVARIIEILSELSRSLGIPVVTPEYEIGLALVDCPGLTAEQLIGQSSFSRSCFFNTMDRLKSSGDVVSTTSPADRRSRIYRLSESTRDLIVSRFKAYRSAYKQYVNQGARDLHPIKHGVLRRRRRAFGNLSCEFQIVYYCHLFANIYNNDLRNLVEVSNTKFLTSLRTLSNLEVINSVTDLSDRRRKMYNIHPNIRQTLDDFHGDVFRWLDGVADFASEETRRDETVCKERRVSATPATTVKKFPREVVCSGTAVLPGVNSSEKPGWA